MLKKLLWISICHLFMLPVCAQIQSFENGIPSNFSTSSSGQISTSQTYAKDGHQSLKWEFSPKSELKVKLSQSLSLNSTNLKKVGFYMWVYNEEAAKDSITIELLSSSNAVLSRFSYRLFSKGWRAGWIGLDYMESVSNSGSITSYRIIAPDRKGTIYLDRLTFPVMNRHSGIYQDLQLPHNNKTLLYRVHQWALNEYDLPLPSKLTATQEEELAQTAKVVDEFVQEDIKRNNNPTFIEEAKKTFNSLNIQRSGKGFTGKPFVGPAEQNKEAGEISWQELGNTMEGLALDAILGKSEQAIKDYLLLWEYALDQGCAWGSCLGHMGNYGYDIEELYLSVWLMREHIAKASFGPEILKALEYYSHLGETRQPFDPTRDALLDQWHGMLFPELITATMEPNSCQRYRKLQGLSRWLSSAILPTPGTLGGFKIDGSTFHHGGFYPAYTVYSLGKVGRVVHATAKKSYEIAFDSRLHFKKVLQGIRNYSPRREWGIGLGGRHPFGGGITENDINAFAYLALAGDLSNEGRDFDYETASDFMRLTSSSNTKIYREFRQKKVKKANAPNGMFVYNHGAVGIYRQKEWVTTIKGYNKFVWGSEIYASDNKYGRYQSYGSVQIFNKKTRKESGYEQEGWDWNRLPGTTTIHLPWNKLEYYSLQAKSSERFAGSSTLKGESGMFAMKLKEGNFGNFTPSFVARKSVFCFGNRLICLGTGISNNNSNYDTETTLFQSKYYPGREAFVNNEKTGLDYLKTFEVTKESPLKIKDGYNNYYYLKEGKVTVKVENQESRHEKTKEITKGDYSSAWIMHGKSPKAQSYEYLVWIEPEQSEVANSDPMTTYQVIQKDNNAHIVTDLESKTTGYAAFENVTLTEDPLLKAISAECMVMVNQEASALTISVCDPDLNLASGGYTTGSPSRPKTKTITLKGKWKLNGNNDRVSVSQTEQETTLTISCQYGIPVEFQLIDNDAESGITELTDAQANVYVENQSIYLQATYPAQLSVYDQTGRMLASEQVEPSTRMDTQLANGIYIVRIQTQNQDTITKIVIR